VPVVPVVLRARYVSGVLDALYDALAAAAWPRALELALEAWRTARIPELADIVDAVAARCSPPTPPDDRVARHAWWVEHGVFPDPVTAGSLLAVLRDRPNILDTPREDVRTRWSSRPESTIQRHLTGTNRRYMWPTNFQERFALLLEWPDDPRIGRVLLDLVRAAEPPTAYGFAELDDLIAERIGVLGDTRLLEALAILVAEPRGQNEVTRTRQVKIAGRARAAISARPSGPSRAAVNDDFSARLAECLALVIPRAPEPPLPPRIDIAALWREVAANPDDVGTRAVLGDALIECGDLRGDIIVLQCNAKVESRPLRGSKRDTYDGRVRTLIRKQWETWLGDLSLVILRRGSEFRCGMLEVVRVGSAASPGWAFAKARGHRELCAVHTVRPAWVTPDHYASFLAALPRFPSVLAIDSADIADLFSTIPSVDRLRTLELIENPRVLGGGAEAGLRARPLRTTLERIAAHAPGLTELRVEDATIARDLTAAVPAIHELFPALKRIAVLRELVDAVPELAAGGRVDIAEPRRRP